MGDNIVPMDGTLAVVEQDGILVVDSRLVASASRVMERVKTNAKSIVRLVNIDGVLGCDTQILIEQLGQESGEVFCLMALGLWDCVPDVVTPWELLAIVQQFSYSDVEASAGVLWDVIDSLSYFLPKKDAATFAYLKLAVISDIAHNDKCRISESGRVHSWFEKSFACVIPFARLVEVKARDGKRPDFLVEVQGVAYPVECKLSFGQPALKQLKSYMKLWNVDKGYAVAPKLCTPLPKNVEFIQCP